MVWIPKWNDGREIRNKKIKEIREEDFERYGRKKFD